MPHRIALPHKIVLSNRIACASARCSLPRSLRPRVPSKSSCALADLRHTCSRRGGKNTSEGSLSRFADLSLRAFSPSAADLTQDIEVLYPDNEVALWFPDKGEPEWIVLEAVFMITLQGFDESEPTVYGNVATSENGDTQEFIVAFEDGSDAHRHAKWIKAKTPNGEVSTFVEVLEPSEMWKNCVELDLGVTFLAKGTDLETFNPKLLRCGC